MRYSVAVVGGTGHLGAALSRRWARAGHHVVIGSREASRANSAAELINAELGTAVRGMSNLEAAAVADIVVLTVPFSSQAAALQEIAPVVTGKIVIDTTVPLVPPRVMRVQLPPAGSAAVTAQQLLGAGVVVAAAFHNVAAHRLATDDAIDCDVLAFSDSKEARSVVIQLANAAGMRGLHGGALANSAAAEALTSVLIFINKIYAVDGAGLRITGTLSEPQGPGG